MQQRASVCEYLCRAILSFWEGTASSTFVNGLGPNLERSSSHCPCCIIGESSVSHKIYPSARACVPSGRSLKMFIVASNYLFCLAETSVCSLRKLFLLLLSRRYLGVNWRPQRFVPFHYPPVIILIIIIINIQRHAELDSKTTT